MLVICEDCAKKYNIDESRIRGNRARFTCKDCGHIIIVNKSDLSRPLVSSGHEAHHSYDSSSTIDLLKEMEEPLFSGSLPEKGAITDDNGKQPSKQKVKRKNRGIPIFVFFIITMLFALVLVSIVTGYLYTEYLYAEYLSNTLNQAIASREDIMVKSSLIFGGAWFVILVFIFMIALYVHKKLKELIKNANQLSQGHFDIIIVKNGPREVRDLAFALERIRNRMIS